MEEKEKIRFRYFLDHKARDLTPEVKKVFLIEFDPDNQGKTEKELAKALDDKVLSTYRRLKSIMYGELGFQGKSRKREAYLHQLKREFSDSSSEQELKRLEIEELNSLSQSLLLSHDQLGALVAAVKAGRKLQETEAPFDTRIRTLCRLWQIVYSVKERNRFEGHNGEVTSVSFSPDGQKLVSASEDGTVRIWSFNGTWLKTLKNTDSFIKVWDVKFSANGKTLGSADERGRVVLWDLDDDSELPILEHDTKATSVSFSTDGEILASGDYEGTVKLWSLKVGELEPFQLGGKNIYSISFIPKGQILAVAIDSMVKLLSLDGTELETFTHQGVNFVSVSCSANGQTLAFASWNGEVGLWNPNSGELQSIGLHSGSISSISLCPNGQMLASAGDDGIVRLWNLDGKELQCVIREMRSHSVNT